MENIILVNKPEGNGPLARSGVDGRIILKFALWKYDEGVDLIQ
jgi:hypothetical protein